MRGKGLGVRSKGSAGYLAQLVILAACIIVLSSSFVSAQTPLAPPQDVRAFDTPAMAAAA